MYLWNTSRLALALANSELSSDQKFKYLLVSYGLYAAAGYLGSLFAIGSSGWLYWYEGLMVFIFTVIGLSRCRDHYAGARDDRLLENCVILGVPLSFKVTLFSWLAYYSAPWLLKWAIVNSPSSDEAGFTLITYMLSAVHTFYPFIIATFGTAWFYLRLSFHLRKIVVLSATSA